MRVGRRRSAFDGICRQCEWRAGETNERDPVPQFVTQQHDRLEHVTQRFAWIEHSQPVDVRDRSNGMCDRRTLSFDEIEIESKGSEGQE